MLAQPSLFARIVAHDLRSPIAAASEALALSETVEPARAQRLRSIAHENLRRAEQMVSGLRSFVQAEGASASAALVDLRSLLADIVKEIKCVAGGNAAVVRTIGQMGVVYGSESHADHIFRNLIVNAIVHNMEVDDLVVEVGRVDGSETAFYVRDNGRGIPHRDHERIFEPFRGAGQKLGEGMGLGLSLVRSLVSQVGGRVWIESEVGVGATFWFTWPMPDPEPTDVSGQMRSGGAAGTTKVSPIAKA